MALPWILLAQVAAQTIGQLSGARDQRKYQSRLRRDQADANLVSALSGGRLRPQVVDTGPKQSALTRIAQAAGTGLQVADAFRQAGRADEMYNLQKRGLEQDLMRQQTQQDIGAGQLLGESVPLPSERARTITPGSVSDPALVGQQLIPQGSGRVADLLPGDPGYEGTSSLGTLGRAAFDATTGQRNRVDRQEQQALSLARQQAQQQADQQAYERAAEMLKLEDTRANSEATRQNMAEGRRLEQAKLWGEQAARELAASGDEKKYFPTLVSGARMLPGVDKLSDIRFAYGNLRSILGEIKRTGSVGVNQVAVLNSFQRLIDPATVREGDIDLYRSSQSFLSQIALQVEKSGSDVLVNDQMINQMETAAEAMIGTYLRGTVDQLEAFSPAEYLPRLKQSLGVSALERLTNEARQGGGPVDLTVTVGDLGKADAVVGFGNADAGLLPSPTRTSFLKEDLNSLDKGAVRIPPRRTALALFGSQSPGRGNR
jgi:hypothetical protein